MKNLKDYSRNILTVYWKNNLKGRIWMISYIRSKLRSRMKILLRMPLNQQIKINSLRNMSSNYKMSSNFNWVKIQTKLQDKLLMRVLRNLIRTSCMLWVRGARWAMPLLPNVLTVRSATLTRNRCVVCRPFWLIWWRVRKIKFIDAWTKKCRKWNRICR